MEKNLSKKISYKLINFEYRTDMMNTPEYSHFPTSYPRRLPCEHWKRFPINPVNDIVGVTSAKNLSTQDLFCEPCQTQRHQQQIEQYQEMQEKKQTPTIINETEIIVQERNLMFQHDAHIYRFMNRQPSISKTLNK